MGKNKAELLAEARDLGVDVPEGATNRQITKLLKPARDLARVAKEPAADQTGRRMGPTRRGTPRLPDNLRN